MSNKKVNLKTVLKTVRENRKLEEKYWNEKKTWSRNELLEFIRRHVDLDTIT